MITPKPESKPDAKSRQKEPARKRRFQVIKLEERIAPSTAMRSTNPACQIRGARCLTQ